MPVPVAPDAETINLRIEKENLQMSTLNTLKPSIQPQVPSLYPGGHAYFPVQFILRAGNVIHVQAELRTVENRPYGLSFDQVVDDSTYATFRTAAENGTRVPSLAKTGKKYTVGYFRPVDEGGVKFQIPVTNKAVSNRDGAPRISFEPEGFLSFRELVAEPKPVPVVVAAVEPEPEETEPTVEFNSAEVANLVKLLLDRGIISQADVANLAAAA